MGIIQLIPTRTKFLTVVRNEILSAHFFVPKGRRAGEIPFFDKHNTSFPFLEFGQATATWLVDNLKFQHGKEMFGL